MLYRGIDDLIFLRLISGLPDRRVVAEHGGFWTRKRERHAQAVGAVIEFQLARQLGHHGQHLPFTFDGLECLQEIFLPGVQMSLLSSGAGVC